MTTDRRLIHTTHAVALHVLTTKKRFEDHELIIATADNSMAIRAKWRNIVIDAQKEEKRRILREDLRIAVDQLNEAIDKLTE